MVKSEIYSFSKKMKIRHMFQHPKVSRYELQDNQTNVFTNQIVGLDYKEDVPANDQVAGGKFPL